jgi:hypothetical protein
MTRVRQKSLRSGRPIWLSGHSARSRSSYPQLTGVREADVVIVAGGMTGASTALEFAQAGVSAGGNGMTFGLLAARMLKEQWQGVQSPDRRLFRFGRLR